MADTTHDSRGDSPYATRPWLKHYDYWVRPTLNYPGKPLHEILDLTAIEVPDKPATAFFGAILTFQEIKTRADRLCAAIACFGIGKGDRVGIMLPNCPQYMIASFALLRLGAVIVNINPLYTTPEVLVVAKDSGIRMLLTLDKLAPLAFAVRGQLSLEHVLVTSIEEYTPAAAPPPRVDGAVTLSDLVNDVSAPPPAHSTLSSGDLAVLQYTGGTTGGPPKGAMLTHGNIFANVIQMEVFMNRSFVRGEARHLLVIPYFHIYAFTVGMMMSTWIGALQVLFPKYDVEQLLAAIRDYKPTYVPAVPTIFVSLLNHPKVKEFGLEKVKTFNSGAAPCPTEVLTEFERRIGRPLNEGYGLSEASPVTHTTAQLARRKLGSVGLPLPDTDFKIVDLDTGERELPVGEAGELCIAGPQVMQGYWNQPEATAHMLRTDAAGRVWLYTGDIARMDEEGYTSIVQRKKDMIIVSGFNVYPADVESVLYAHPAVREAAVIGVPDKYRGEIVRAFVVLRADHHATSEDLIAHCKESLTEYKIPKCIDIRANLPTSAAGKVLYRVLRDEVQAAAATGNS